MSAAYPPTQYPAHTTDHAAGLLHAACRAMEIAGQRHRLQCLTSLRCDHCRLGASTHSRVSHDIPHDAPAPSTFSLHLCEERQSRRIMILCKYCTRRARAGTLTNRSQTVKWLAHVPTSEPKS